MGTIYLNFRNSMNKIFKKSIKLTGHPDLASKSYLKCINNLVVYTSHSHLYVQIWITSWYLHCTWRCFSSIFVYECFSLFTCMLVRWALIWCINRNLTYLRGFKKRRKEKKKSKSYWFCPPVHPLYVISIYSTVKAYSYPLLYHSTLEPSSLMDLSSI